MHWLLPLCGVSVVTQEHANLLAAQVSALLVQQQYLSEALNRGEVSKEVNDTLRALFRSTTRDLLRAVIARQRFQRSAEFSRFTSLRSLRDAAANDETVIAAADAADRLVDAAATLTGKKVKRELTCELEFHQRRPLVACNTVAHRTPLSDKRRRLSPTPHPRAGKEAVEASGGAVQALLDEPCEGEEGEEVAVGTAVFSSTDEEDSSSDSD